MLSHSQQFQDLLSNVEDLLKSSRFPPSWSETAELSTLDEPEILEALFQLAANSEQKETPYEAFEYLLHCTLLELMILIRHGQSRPNIAWSRLQHVLVRALQSEHGNDELFTIILDHISNHNLPLESETLEAIIRWQQSKFEPSDEETYLTPEEINIELAAHLQQLQISTEYEFYQLFADRLTYFADEAIEGFVCDLLGAEQEILREGALLFLLHKRKAVRLAIIDALQDSFFLKRLSPIGLRRLITSRNWLPADEKPLIDKIIKSARKAGLTCESAQVPESIQLLKVYASTTDGVGATSAVCIFKIGRQFALAGAIFKERFGMLDTWVSPLTTRKECELQIKRMKEEVYSLQVDEEWLRTILPHFLALNVESNEPLTAETLLWTEWLGLDIWQPQPVDLNGLLASWHNEYPQLFSNKSTEKAYDRSSKWLNKADFAQGWYEQDDALEERVNDFFSHNLPKNAPSTVDYLLSPYREKWRNRFILMALWAKHNCMKRGPQWQDFAIVAKSINASKDLHEIPVLRCIAYNTLDYYSALRSQQDNASSPSDLHGPADKLSIQETLDVDIEAEDNSLFFQVHGFLCAINCALSPPKKEKWMQFILDEAFLDFDPTEHSNMLDQFIEDLTVQNNAIVSELKSSTLELPEEGTFSMLDCSDWSDGFIQGVTLTGGLRKWNKLWQKEEHEPLRAGLALIKAAADGDPDACTLLSESPQFLSQLVMGFFLSLHG